MVNPRKPTDKESERVVRSLLANGDELFQFTQLKASLRLLRDDDTIDKDLLGYADRAISIRFNSLLKEAVPKVEKAERSVGEILSVTDDPLLKSARERRYVVKFDDVSVPFEDLRYWAAEGGYSLSVTDNRNSTIVSKEEGGRYLIKCPKCDDQPLKLIRQGEELEAIACSKCRTKLVRVDSTTTRRSQRNNVAKAATSRRQARRVRRQPPALPLY